MAQLRNSLQKPVDDNLEEHGTDGQDSEQACNSPSRHEVGGAVRIARSLRPRGGGR